MKPRSSTNAFERATRPAKPKKVVLRLYIAGSTDRSTRAIQNAKEICDEHLADYDLDVVDLLKQPSLAKDDQILAVPTLIKKLPLPLRRIIGDLSDRDGVLVGLDLKQKKKR